MAQAKLFGSSIKRREDPRFITGRGLYTDDVKLRRPDVRGLRAKPFAHARVRRVDRLAGQGHARGRGRVSPGRTCEGGVGPLPVGWLLPDIKIRRVPRGRHGHGQLRGRRGGGCRSAETPCGPGRCRRRSMVDYDVLPAVADAREGRARGAPDARRTRPATSRFRLVDRRQGQDGRRDRGRRQGRQAAPDQPPPHPQRHRAAGVDRHVQRGDRRAHALGHVAESARASADHGGVRPGDAGAQVARHRAGRRRRLRLQDLPLSGRGDRLLGVEAARAPGEVDRGRAARAFVTDCARPRPRSPTRRWRSTPDGKIVGAARQDRREPGRVPVALRAGVPTYPLRARCSRARTTSPRSTAR